MYIYIYIHIGVNNVAREQLPYPADATFLRHQTALVLLYQYQYCLKIPARNPILGECLPKRYKSNKYSIVVLPILAHKPLLTCSGHDVKWCGSMLRCGHFTFGIIHKVVNILL